MKTIFTTIFSSTAIVIAFAASGYSEQPGVGHQTAASIESVDLGGDVPFGRCDLVWVGDVPAGLRSHAAGGVDRSFRGPCDEANLRHGIQSVLQLLVDAGHYRCEVRPGDFTADRGALNFTLTIDPGPTVAIAGWRFVGLSHTDTLWLSRALCLPTGIAATREMLAAAQLQLRRISHLQSVAPPEVELRPGDTTATVVLRLREEPAATFNGALAAGGEGGAAGGTAIAGSLSLGLNGLFRRDRSLALRYERLRRDEMLFRLEAAETARFRGRIDWRLRLEEWDRGDHRQQVALQTACRLDRQRDRRAEIALQWSKITPGRAVISPARILATSFGVAQGASRVSAMSLDRSATAWSFHATYSSRRETTTSNGSIQTFRRTLLELRIVREQRLGKGLSLRLCGRGRWWPLVPGQLGPGDEWFLGGVEGLRGYTERAVAAASGAVATVEASGQTTRGIGASAFVDAARLEPFGSGLALHSRPFSYGIALRLLAPDRTGRLEFAWRDHAAWRDGIVRLTVSQGW